MGLQVIVTQVAMLAIVMALGFIGIKLKYLEGDIRNSLSKVILRITLPALIITSITGQNLNGQLVKNAALVSVLAVLCIGILSAAGALGSKLFGLQGSTKTIHTLMSSFGNVIFLGYPLITALYGEEGLFYAIIYALINDSFVWTWGLYLMCKDSGQSAKKAAMNLINPNTIAFVISLLMLSMGLKLPDVIHNALSGVGGLTTNLSMLFIGMTLALIDFREIYKRYTIFVLSAVKMIIIPSLLILLLNLLKIYPVVLGTVILQAAMPVQTVLTILANEYKSDFKYATECVFITTALSLFTLPFIYYLILQFVS